MDKAELEKRTKLGVGIPRAAFLADVPGFRVTGVQHLPK